MIEAWRKAFDLPPDESPWAWAERNVRISPRNPSAFPGPYRTSLTPYVRGIMDAVKDGTIHTITVQKGAQTGLSLSLHVCVCYFVVEDPCPILLVMPSVDMARSCSETRLIPLIEDSPAVRAELTGNADEFKKLEYRFRRALVNLVGGNSPGNLASRPVRVLLVDEADKLPRQTDDEAGAIPLAIERTKTFWNRKVIVVSTPTTPRGYIAMAEAKGDRRRYFVSCPVCGEYQVLKWPNVRFDAKLPIGEAAAGARYKCEHCPALWTDSDKIRAVEAGEWRATAVGEPGHASFHLSSLYAPWVTWSGLVQKWLSAQGDSSALQNFINSELGEVWEVQPKSRVERGAVYQLKLFHRYARATIPTGDPCVLVLAVDVMDRFISWSVWACSIADVYLVDHGRAPDFRDVEEIATRKYNQVGKEHPVELLAVDTGYRTVEAYDWCMRMAKRMVVVPIKGDPGQATTQAEPIRAQRLGTYPGGQPLPFAQSIVLRHMHPTHWHYQVAEALQPIEPEDGETQDDAWKRRQMRVHFHEEIDEDFVDELTAEVMVESEPDKYGNVKQTWKRIRRNNHRFDEFRYTLAMRYLMRDDLVRMAAPAAPAPAQTDRPAKAARPVATYD